MAEVREETGYKSNIQYTEFITMIVKYFIEAVESKRYSDAVHYIADSFNSEQLNKFAVDEAIVILKETYSSWKMGIQNLENSIKEYRSGSLNFEGLKINMLDYDSQTDSFYRLAASIICIELYKDEHYIINFIEEFVFNFRGRSNVEERKMKEYLMRLSSLVWKDKPLLGAIYG